jgi:polyketide synthase 12
MPTDDRLTPPAGAPAWRLEAPRKGMIENLVLIAYPEALEPLLPHQVRVNVKAAGVNFRDLLTILGLYPGRQGLGLEGAGVVIEVGSAVTSVVPGDRVMGLLPGGFGPTAVTDHRSLTHVPAGWSFVEAASTPVAFLTAYYALVHLARITPGESLLVHAAAGGVGLASTQLAQHWGAEVFGTAHPRKWDVLRAEGIRDDRLASSRTLEFEDKFRRTTRGRGVDIVLNSLAGEFIDASLRLLSHRGRFIEMGKIDTRDAEWVTRTHANLHYRRFVLTDAGPGLVRHMLAELVGLFASGALRTLPVTTWNIHRARDAFRFLSQTRHIGKIVFTIP